MIEASIETTNDPSSPAMKHVMEDATNPNRQEALRAAFTDLEQCGEKPFEHNIRTARPGEEITGQVLGHDNRVASIVTDDRIVAVDRADLPKRLPDDHDITFTARSDFSAWGASSRPPWRGNVRSSLIPRRAPRANGRRSKIRAFVEHVLAQQKSRMGLFVRTIGIARARTKIGMANLAYNLTRFVWHQGRTASP
ncbi:cell filamentation protein (plasmid) [Rhizobium favelukesii]|uniref:Cell filamentation protein n=1 Tax=Rhizobium favelukesii TaxID=348824 RepID=W6RGP5_9HYPH|nr:cell filamentation protein [Rhizobium favelukesii]